MDLLYAGGLDHIMTNLNEDLDLFRETDAALTSLLEPLWLKFGWTIQGIEEEAEKYKAELGKSQTS